MRTRMDDLGRDLSDALERAERESKRNRFLSDLGSSVEFEELLDRVLDAALEVPGFDAAMVVLDDGGGASSLATRGMTPDEAAHPPSSGAAGTMPAGPITVNYRYGAADAADTHLIRGGLFLSLVARDGSSLGSLALFWRSPGYEPPAERIAAIEQIAETCIPAIENARRYREARQLAETDALTGFFNQRYFHETLRRESLRAQRYDRRLALLILDLDDFKSVNDRIGHLAGDAVLAQIAERLRNEIRSVDIGCRVGGDEFAVIMPESSSEDASQLFDRMHDAVATMSVPGGPRCASRRGSPSSATARPRRASSSAPTRRSTARRTRARIRRRWRPTERLCPASAGQLLSTRAMSACRLKPDTASVSCEPRRAAAAATDVQRPSPARA